jgi:HEAT repeat protein
LEDEYAPVRFAAVLAIGDLEYSIAKDTVSKLLRDNDASVIAAAAYTMGKLGSIEYNRILYSAINNQDQTVRANAALLLGKSGDRNAIKPLYWAMQDKSSEDKVVYQAAESLAMLGDLAIYPKLWSMLISAYADVRVVGVRAMGIFGTRQAREALITMLDDNILEVRLAAAAQLGMMGDTSGESMVLSVFEKGYTISLDTEINQRVYALTALAIGQIKTPKLTKFLPQLLKNESKFVRIAAAKAVFQSGIE